MIISENIHNINDYTWAEVSGRIEEFYRENGGLNIKAEYAPLYLGKTVSILTDDEYHYTRLIGQKPLVKTIYGIKDKNIIDQMIDEDAKSVRDFIHENETGFVNEEYDFYKYYKTKERWENAKVIVDGLYDLYENYFYYEFPEDLYRALLKYFSIIEEDLNEGNITEDMIRRMKECVERCHELMENVTLYKTFKI